MKRLLSLCLALLSLVAWAQNRTQGGISPIIRSAQDISVEYGVTAQLVYGLLNVYERQHISEKQRLQAVQKLLGEYRDLRQSGNLSYQFSPEQKRQLGIANNQPLENYLEWNTFLTTYGDYSPILIARGDVEVAYGLPQQVFEQVWAKLEKQQLNSAYFRARYEQSQNELRIAYENNEYTIEQLSDIKAAYQAIEAELKNASKAYSELKQLLQGEDNDASREAQKLLSEGDLDGAIRVMKDRLFALRKAKERIEKGEANAFFVLGKAYESKLEYDSAFAMFREAVSYDYNNSKYLNSYGLQFERFAILDSAIKYYYQATVTDSLAGHTDSLGVYYNNLSSAYESLGDYDRAIELGEKALAILESVYGSEHHEVATALNNLASVFHSKGDLNLAIQFYERALYIDTTLYGALNSRTIALYVNIGYVHYSNAAHSQSDFFYKKALEIASLKYPSNHPKLAIIYSHLAGNRSKKGDLQQAMELSKKALFILEEVYGHKHPDVASVFNNIAVYYNMMGNRDTSVMFFERALHMYKDIYGEFHPAVASIYNSIGSVYTNQARVSNSSSAKALQEKAIKMLEKALAIDSVVFGPSHPNVARDCQNLAVIYEFQGDYWRASTFIETSLEINIFTFGKSHPRVALGYSSLGHLYTRRGLYYNAIQCHEKALSINKNIYGLCHASVARNCYDLAETYHYKADFSGIEDRDNAIQMAQDAIALYQTSGDDGFFDIEIAFAYYILGASNVNNNKHKYGIRAIKKSIRILEAHLPRRHKYLRKIRLMLRSAKVSFFLYKVLGGEDQSEKNEAYFSGASIPYSIEVLSSTKALDLAYLKIGAWNFNNYGMECFGNQAWEEAKQYFRASLKMSLASGDSIFAISCLNSLGATMKHLTEYDSALHYLEWGMELAEGNIVESPSIDSETIIQLKFDKASTLWRMGHLEKATIIFGELQDTAIKTGDEELLDNIISETNWSP